MAHSASAQKRIRQNTVHRLRNRRRKEVVKQAVREFETAVAAGQAAPAAEKLRAAFSILDQTAGQGTLHKNTAARKKARLAKRLAKLAPPA